MTQRVFVDANIFVSRTLMDWLFHLRGLNEGMFQLHSSHDVFIEALHSTRKRYPRATGKLCEDRLVKIKACIDEVLTTFPGDAPFSGADEEDYHVHAAALSARADLVLTQNDPNDITRTPDDEPYEIITADEFFMLVIKSNPRCLISATRGQYRYWSSRDKGQLDEPLRRADCPQFAAEVRHALQVIALS